MAIGLKIEKTMTNQKQKKLMAHSASHNRGYVMWVHAGPVYPFSSCSSRRMVGEGYNVQGPKTYRLQVMVIMIKTRPKFLKSPSGPFYIARQSSPDADALPGRYHAVPFPVHDRAGRGEGKRDTRQGDCQRPGQAVPIHELYLS